MSKSFNSLKECLYVDDMVPFGKYVGLTWLDVLAIDPSYIVWCVGNTDHRFDPTLVVRAIQQDYAQRKAATLVKEDVDSYTGPYFGADSDITVASTYTRRRKCKHKYLVEWYEGYWNPLEEPF